MRHIRRLIFLSVALLALHAQAQTTPPVNPNAGTGEMTMTGDAADYITGGLKWHATSADGSWSASIADATKNGIPDVVSIGFDAPTEKPGVGLFWSFDFNTNKVPGDLLVGAYKDAMRAAFTDPGHPGLDVGGDGRGCNQISGTFNITAIEYDCVQNGSEQLLHLKNFAANFEQHCENGVPAARGTVTFTSPAQVACGSVGGGGGTGGGTPAPPPPPVNASISLPSNIVNDPIVLTNESPVQSVQVGVNAENGFSGDVALDVLTNAGEFDNFNATIDRNSIPAPGNGTATVTIHSGANTFPRDYRVSVGALANGTSSYSTFIVSVICDPPLIITLDQPKSQTVTRGSPAALTVKAVGSGPFTYQWYTGARGSTHFPVSNGTGATLNTSDEGMYWVRVSNACGSIDSAPATVTAR